MTILTPLKEPSWSLEDRDGLRAYLESQSGQHLLEMLAWRQQRYTSHDATVRLVESGIREGREDAIQDIFELSAFEQKPQLPPTEAYPSLDDDAAWAKIEQQKQ